MPIFERNTMPMDFPDMDSLKIAAEIHKFRQPHIDELEDDYRSALADYVQSIDNIESGEIRYSIGWDKWDKAQKRDFLKRAGFTT